jgi:catechol 2,3-dioxygenase-like lactoylglutathione lyase family enzyme
MTSTTETGARRRFHLSLDVRDLEASIAFYRDLLDTAPDKRYARFARFTTDAPPLVLSLVANPRAGGPPGRQRVSHLGLRIESPAELDDARRRLAAAGYDLREEPESRCCYALQSKLWITDPDGNEWELYRLLEDLETSGDDTAGCCE